MALDAQTLAALDEDLLTLSKRVAASSAALKTIPQQLTAFGKALGTLKLPDFAAGLKAASAGVGKLGESSSRGAQALAYLRESLAPASEQARAFRASLAAAGKALDGIKPPPPPPKGSGPAEAAQGVARLAEQAHRAAGALGHLREALALIQPPKADPSAGAARLADAAGTAAKEVMRFAGSLKPALAEQAHRTAGALGHLREVMGRLQPPKAEPAAPLVRMGATAGRAAEALGLLASGLGSTLKAAARLSQSLAPALSDQARQAARSLGYFREQMGTVGVALARLREAATAKSAKGDEGAAAVVKLGAAASEARSGLSLLTAGLGSTLRVLARFAKGLEGATGRAERKGAPEKAAEAPSGVKAGAAAPAAPPAPGGEAASLAAKFGGAAAGKGDGGGWRGSLPPKALDLSGVKAAAVKPGELDREKADAAREKAAKEKESREQKRQDATASQIKETAATAKAVGGGDLGSIGSMIGGAVGGPAGAAIGQIIGDNAVAAIVPGLVPLKMAAGAVKDAFMSVVSTVRPFTDAFSPSTGEAFDRAMRDTTAVVGRTLLPVMQAAVEVVREFGDAIVPAMQAFEGPVREVTAELMSYVRPAIAAVGGGLVGIAEAVRGFMEALAPLQPVVSALFDALRAAAAIVQGTLMVAFTGLARVLSAIVGGEGRWQGLGDAIRRMAVSAIAASAALARLVGATHFVTQMRRAFGEGQQRGASTGVAAATNPQIQGAMDWSRSLALAAATATGSAPTESRDDAFQRDVIAALDAVNEMDVEAEIRRAIAQALTDLGTRVVTRLDGLPREIATALANRGGGAAGGAAGAIVDTGVDAAAGPAMWLWNRIRGSR